MDVSIIIVNYKTPQLVIDCVKSIYEKTKEISYEIIVVDNDSQDNSQDIICNELNDKIKYIQSNVNLGFGKANNLGAKYAIGKYLFLLNSDTLLVNNAIKELFDFIEKHKNCGIVGGNLFTVDMKPNPSYSRMFDTIDGEKKISRWSNILIDIIKSKLGLYRNEKQNEKSFNYSEYPIKVGYIYGADLLIRKSLFEELNGFDKDFFMYAEEEELSFRVVNKGYEIWNIPSAKIIHFEGASIKNYGPFNEKQYRMKTESIFKYYDKTYGENGSYLCYKYRKSLLKKMKFLGNVRNNEKIVKFYGCKLSVLNEEYVKYTSKIEV